MRRKAIWSGMLCLFAATMLVGCKPALRSGEASSDAFAASMTANVRPIDTLKASAKAQDNGAVKVRWSSVSRARSYVLLRSEDAGASWETIKTLKSGKTSYTDDSVQAGMEYAYKVQTTCEYSKADYFAYKKAQMPEMLEAECTIYTGVGDAVWAQNLRQTKQTQLGEIHLAYSFGAQGQQAAAPEGVEIFRGTSKKNLTLLERGLVKELSTETMDYAAAYIDQNVTQGKSYYYRVRAYALRDGKRVYGKWSSVLRIQAPEPDGSYTVRVVREPGSYSSHLTVAVTSDNKENGTLTLSQEVLTDRITWMQRMTETYYQQAVAAGGTEMEGAAKKPPYQALQLKTERYSMDGTSYYSLQGDLTLQPQQTVYLELSPVDAQQSLLPLADVSDAQLSFRVQYNEGKHLLKMDLKKVTAQLEDLAVDGGFQMWTESAGKGQVSQVTIGLLSRYCGNQTLTISKEQLESLDYTYQCKNDESLMHISLRVAQYSTDGVTWKKPGSKGILWKPCESLYLRLRPAVLSDSTTYPYRAKGQRHGTLQLTGTYGTNADWSMSLDFLGKR